MTTPPSELTPPISKTPFFVADGVILLVAVFIAFTGPATLGVPELLGIAACVGLGALLSVVPFVIDYTRREEAAFAARKAQLTALARDTAAAVEKLSALSHELPVPTPIVPAPPPPPSAVATEEFKSLHARLDGLEHTLARAIAESHAALRPLLDERRAADTQALADTLAAARDDATAQREAARHAFDEAASSARHALAAEADRLLARLDERLTAALASWETRLDTALREHAAAIEHAVAKPAPERRPPIASAPSAPPVEASQLAAPSGKSRLGRGLVSLITSPLAKPADAQLPLPAIEPHPPAPSAFSAPRLQEIITPAPSPAAAKPETATLREAPHAKPTTAAKTVLDPFHIPADGYADLAQAMDAGCAEEDTSAEKPPSPPRA